MSQDQDEYPSPLEVYRRAARDANEGGAGCSGVAMLVLVGIIGLVCHFFGWFGL